jgi:hypothetical protein
MHSQLVEEAAEILVGWALPTLLECWVLRLNQTYKYSLSERSRTELPTNY